MLRELSRFIAAGRLHCKIDKVNEIVETNRYDISCHKWGLAAQLGSVHCGDTSHSTVKWFGVKHILTSQLLFFSFPTTPRPDSKNWQYQETIKKGDLLLNRVQKLSRVINM